MRFLRLTWVEVRRAMHRRLVRWMIFIGCMVCVAAGVIAFVSSIDPVKFARDAQHPARMVNWWGASGGDEFLTISALFLVVGSAICGASVVGAEWRAGTMTTMLTWMPMRVRLHAARTLSAASIAFVVGFIIQALFLAATLPAVIAHGTTTGTDAAWWVGLLLAMLRISLVTSLVAVLAVSVATVGRNTSAALVVLAGWAIMVERIVAGLWPKLGRFMIGENVSIVVPWTPLTTVEFYRPPSLALATLLLYLAIIVVGSTAIFARRDVATT